MEILEYRGVEGLVAAEVLTDDESSGYTTGTPFAVAGVAQIVKTTDSSNEAHYYDNIPAVVIASNGSDTVKINASALPLDVVAKLTGQHYDPDTGSMTEGERQVKYFALGYKTRKSNGDEMYVWRLKGTFAVPDEEANTIDKGTSANGQTLVYTGISTTKVFSETGKRAKALVVDVAQNKANVTSFFNAVTTPDTLVAKTAYTLTKTQGASTTLTIVRRGEALDNNAAIYAGDELKITVTGGTVTVNSSAFISGDIHVVSGNTTVVSTHS